MAVARTPGIELSVAFPGADDAARDVWSTFPVTSHVGTPAVVRSVEPGGIVHYVLG